MKNREIRRWIVVHVSRMHRVPVLMGISIGIGVGVVIGIKREEE